MSPPRTCFRQTGCSAKLIACGWPGVGLGRGELAEGTVRPAGVVVQYVLGQYPTHVVLIDDQQPVKEFPAQGADDPFADGVCSGRLRRAGENPDARCREHGIEGAGELACAIPDQELDRGRALAEVHQEVASCLCRPRAVWMCGDAGQVDAASAVLDDDQGIEAPQLCPVRVVRRTGRRRPSTVSSMS